jgi:hypothetical protein
MVLSEARGLSLFLVIRGGIACKGLTSLTDLTVPQGLEMWGREMNAVAPAQAVEIFQHHY